MPGVGSALQGLNTQPEAAAQPEMFGGEVIEQPRRGRGRPKGAQNLHSAKVRAFILGRFDNPLQGLVAASMPADLLQITDKARALSKLWRCSVKEAIELMIKCSEASNRYLNSPPPVDVNVTDRRVVLAMGIGAPQAVPGGDTGGAQGLDALRQLMLERAAGRSDAQRAADEATIDAIAEMISETST